MAPDSLAQMSPHPVPSQLFSEIISQISLARPASATSVLIFCEKRSQPIRVSIEDMIDYRTSRNIPGLMLSLRFRGYCFRKIFSKSQRIGCLRWMGRVDENLAKVSPLPTVVYSQVAYSSINTPN